MNHFRNTDLTVFSQRASQISEALFMVACLLLIRKPFLAMIEYALSVISFDAFLLTVDHIKTFLNSNIIFT